MNKETSRPYNLLHITSLENAQKILKNGFKKSIHNLHEYKNQWLGDGVYFWDGNDETVNEFGKNMLKNKFKIEEMVEIYGSLEIKNNNHINLEDDNQYNTFTKFMKKVNPQKAEVIIKLGKILQQETSLKNKNLSKIGKILGKNINMYLSELEKKEYKIDMVSCYFYHGTNKIKRMFSRTEKIRRQFCIKNIDLLNNNINNFKVYNK